MRDARRGGFGGPTGVNALVELLRRQATEAYSTITEDSPYVPWVADQIAEPTYPEQVCDILQHLPARVAEYYASEEKVLELGEIVVKIPQDLDRRYSRVVGSILEWRKYHHREELRLLWYWVSDDSIKAPCAVCAVPKMNGALRKALAVNGGTTRPAIIVISKRITSIPARSAALAVTTSPACTAYRKTRSADQNAAITSSNTMLRL